MIEIIEILDNLESVPDTHNEGTEYRIIGDTLYVKGSDDISDWLVNFSTIDREVHTGFLIESTMIYFKIRNSNIKKIVGHSAGGAIACLIGYAMKIPVITFGSPKFYNRKKAKKIHDYCLNHCTHYILKRDPVCFLPFWYSRKGGKEMKLNNRRLWGHFIKDYRNSLAGR